MSNLNKISRTIGNGIWPKHQRLQVKFGKGFLSILEYFNERITKYGSKKVKVGCCENHSKLYKADEDAALKSIVLIALDNNSTLLSILDNFYITMKYLEGTSTDGCYVCTCKNWSGRRQLRIVRPSSYVAFLPCRIQFN